MALFQKRPLQHDPTDIGLLGGVISWQPTHNDELVWKYPSTRIKKGAKLQVHDTQEAALFINGSCARVFRGGGDAYTIDESCNIPLLDSALNLATGGENVYFAEIWFVNVGTARKISWFVDEHSGLKFQANGTVYSGRMFSDAILRVVDTDIFLKEFVGKEQHKSADDVEEFINRNLISKSVQSIISIYRQMNIRFDEFITLREQLEAQLQLSINTALEDSFGIQLSHLAIARFFSPDLEEFWAAQKKRVSLAELGVNYSQERQLDIMQSAASNEGGAGTLMGAGLGMGAGASMGHMMGTAINTPTPPPLPQQVQYFYSEQGAQAGPVEFSTLQGMILSRQITMDSLIWKAGMPQWAAASSLVELTPLFAQVPPPLP